MSSHDFANQLENFRQEAELIAQLVYGDFAVNQAALESETALAALNDTPRFWNLWSYATQIASYMAIGRVFDLKAKYTLEALLDSFEKNLSEFQTPALRARKDPLNLNPPWLDRYLAEAYYPTHADVQRLRKIASRRRQIYDRMIKPARHKYFAHREKHHEDEVRDLFGRGTIQELWLLATFLLQFHFALFQLFLNGRKPVLRRVPYSMRTLYKNKAGNNLPHYKLIGEVKELMRRVIAAAPNNSLGDLPKVDGRH